MARTLKGDDAVIAEETASARGTGRRTPWPRFLLRAGLTLLVVLGTGAYLAERFHIGYDDQNRQCLPPHRWFLIDRHDRDITQGEIVAFAARGLGNGIRLRNTPIRLRIQANSAEAGLAARRFRCSLYFFSICSPVSLIASRKNGQVLSFDDIAQRNKQCLPSRF